MPALRYFAIFAFLVSASAAQGQPTTSNLEPRTSNFSYTNHAGIAIAAVPVKMEAKFVTLSNAAEVVRCPLSSFPESECRRMAADCARLTGDRSVLRIPAGVRRAIAGNEQAMRRSAKRAEKGLCTKEEAQAFAEKSRKSLKAYLDRQQSAGVLTPEERSLLP